MQSTEHKQRMEQVDIPCLSVDNFCQIIFIDCLGLNICLFCLEVLKETGKGNLDELGLEVYTVGADEEGMDSEEEERVEEENGQVEEIW